MVDPSVQETWGLMPDVYGGYILKLDHRACYTTLNTTNWMLYIDGVDGRRVLSEQNCLNKVSGSWA